MEIDDKKKEEDEKPIEEDETIKAIRLEYEAQLKLKDEEHAKEIKALEEKHISQLKALVSGREEPKDEIKPKEKTIDEQIIDNLEKKFKIK